MNFQVHRMDFESSPRYQLASKAFMTPDFVTDGDKAINMQIGTAGGFVQFRTL
jgi:hypothetical protein